MQVGHLAKAAGRLAGVVGALLILISAAEAAAPLCKPGTEKKALEEFKKQVEGKLPALGRAARFNMTFVKSDSTSRLLVSDPDETGGLAVYAVTEVEVDKLKRVPARVISREEDAWAIDFAIPDRDLRHAFWSSSPYYVWACSAASADPATATRFVAVLDARASHRVTSVVLALVLVGALYLLVAIGYRATGREFAAAMGVSAPDGFTLNPIKLTAGLTGRGSISNLQIFIFSLIVLFLLTYIVLRTGVLSGLSENVIWLLGIVGGGSVAARIVANARDKLTPLNLRWTLKRDWLHYQTTSANLVMRDREFSVSRFQSIAFTSVVAIALLINGFTDLETFTIPASLLGLLGASQENTCFAVFHPAPSDTPETRSGS